MKMVLVVWEDAHQEDGTWIRKSELKPIRPTIINQVGYLLEDNETEIILTHAAQDSDDDPCYAARDRIPRGMVRGVFELTITPRPRKARA